MPLIRSILALIFAVTTAGQALANDPLAGRWTIGTNSYVLWIKITDVNISLPNAAGRRTIEIFGRCARRAPADYVVCKWGTFETLPGQPAPTVLLPERIDDGNTHVPCTLGGAVFFAGGGTRPLDVYIRGGSCWPPHELHLQSRLRRVPTLDQPIRPKLPKIPGG
jgi:hypothetical protein